VPEIDRKYRNTIKFFFFLMLSLVTVLSIYPVRKGRAVAVDQARQADQVVMIAMGDHGSGDFRQRRVAALLEDTCGSLPQLDFVQTLGDNFYNYGVQSIEDPLWKTGFEEMYGTPCLLETDFYAVLGNHDLARNPYAQVEYGIGGYGTGRWHMPDLSFAQEFGISGGRTLVKIVMLNTN
jgi:tartrate-resistant acid phosphatase type 5